MNIIEHILTKYPYEVQNGVIHVGGSRWVEFLQFIKDAGVKKMVEIGVYKGKFSEALMRTVPDMDLTCVDAWTGYPEYRDYNNDHLTMDAYVNAKERSERFGFKIKKGWSLDVVKEFEDESLDMVFIDANHDFRYVVDDLDEWSKKVKKGGIVSGHDFFRNRHQGFGVREALPAWCEAYGIAPLFSWSKDKCPTWMYVKP